jgi:hypothetical protein
VRTLYGGSLMRMVTRIFPLAVLALGLGTAQLSAQGPVNTFQWFVGGHGGIMNFETPLEGHKTKPMGGAHLLITAKRTGLLLSVEQAFGSNQAASYNFTVFDSAGFVSSSSEIPVTWNSLRKYSAMLMAFPIKGPMTPFFGLGVGVMHTVGHNPDDGDTRAMGSSGFGSLIGGLNFKVSHFSAFGQYQITSGPSLEVITHKGPAKSTLVSSGNLFKGPTHTFSAGLRFGLGNARERASGGGY